MQLSRTHRATRISALALAFGVVTGGFALTAAPAFALGGPAEGMPTIATDKADYGVNDAVAYFSEGWEPGSDYVVTIDGPLSGEIPGSADAEGVILDEIVIYETIDGVQTGNLAPWEVGTYTLTLEGTCTPTPAVPVEGDDDAVDPVDTTEPTEPVDTTEPTEPVDTTEPTEPVDTTEPTDPPSPEVNIFGALLAADAVDGDAAVDGEGDADAIAEPTGCFASTTFTVGGGEATEAPEANGDDELASTGASDIFGIAGLGLLGVGLGAAALVGRRFVAGRKA